MLPSSARMARALQLPFQTGSGVVQSYFTVRDTILSHWYAVGSHAQTR